MSYLCYCIVWNYKPYVVGFILSFTQRVSSTGPTGIDNTRNADFVDGIFALFAMPLHNGRKRNKSKGQRAKAKDSTMDLKNNQEHHINKSQINCDSLLP